MSNNTKDVSVNFPLFGILGLIFITLKLTGHITWSWLWVLSPFWIPIGLGLLILFLVAFFAKN
jgi:FtsH-binding integral membrane protein